MITQNLFKKKKSSCLPDALETTEKYVAPMHSTNLLLQCGRRRTSEAGRVQRSGSMTLVPQKTGGEITHETEMNFKWLQDPKP